MKAGIIAFAFGTPSSILSNQRLALIATDVARIQKASIYTQKDLAFETTAPVVYTVEELGNPPPTLRIARGAAKWAKRNGIKRLWIVAAKPHMWRAVRDVKMALQEEGIRIEICPCMEIEAYPENSWFCRDSTQKRVTSKEEWWKRELILKLMPFWLYTKVAS